MDSTYPKGICIQMCPDSEIIKREKEGLLHFLELDPNINDKHQIADRNRIVKEFSRSAAGRDTQHASNLRTHTALIRTINYLLHDVATISNVKWNLVYDFIMDRLRSVRQDMVIQNFSSEESIILLEPMIRFYVYSAYRLCTEPVSVFDPVINFKHLQECLKRLLVCYDDIDLVSGDDSKIYFNNRNIMESLYLILNLGSIEPLERVINLHVAWKNDLTIHNCLVLSLEYWRGNHVRVCRLISNLPHILLLAAAIKLPVVRMNALATMSVAYNNKDLTFDSSKLVNLLLYDDVNELYNDCSYYNIPIIKFDILFTKQTFQQQKSEAPPRHWQFIEREMMKYTIPQLLLEDLNES